jgi:hypothetical protein
LVHCKGAIGGQISGDIDNFYTVCGQAQKSITVKHLGMTRLYNDLKPATKYGLEKVILGF